MIIPRIGDYWKFYPVVGKRHTTIKKIEDIYWKPDNDGKLRPWIRWQHTPRARYIANIRVKYFLSKKAIGLIKRIDF